MLDLAGTTTEQSLDPADVREEFLSVLDTGPEVELATIYRRLVGRFGADVVPLVSETLAHLLRRNTVMVETRRAGPASPLVGYVRLTARLPATR